MGTPNPLSEHTVFLAGDTAAWSADVEKRLASGEGPHAVRQAQAREGRQIGTL